MPTITLGQTIIDRVAIGSGMADRYKFEFENYDAFLRLLDGGRGAVIIGAHVGCWGTGAGFFGDYARKMHLVMYDAEYRRIKNVMDKHCKQEGYKVIPVNEGGIESILRIKEVLDSKGVRLLSGRPLRRRRRHGTGDLHGPQGPSSRRDPSSSPRSSGRRRYSTMRCANAAGVAASSSTFRRRRTAKPRTPCSKATSARSKPW